MGTMETDDAMEILSEDDYNSGRILINEGLKINFINHEQKLFYN